MDKKSKLIVVVLFAAIIALSGCITKPKEETLTKQAAFVGGSSGLELSFLPGQPPENVPESQPFTVAVKVENKGEAPATGYVTLGGIDLGVFNLKPGISSAQSLSLKGTSKIDESVVPGEQEIVTFDFGGREVFATSDFPLQATAIYNYETKAVSAVCLKENFYAQTTGGTEICKTSGSKAVESSGAPVQVTGVEENPSGFSIKVKNVGSGYPFTSKSLPTKESDISFGEKDRVILKSVELGGQSLTCSQKEIILANGEGQAFCKMPAAVTGEYVDLLAITLEYNYVDKVSTTFTVQNIPAL